MKKDYVAVTAADAASDEAEFVERFWTRQWQERAAPTDTARLARTPKYRLIRPYLDALPRGSAVLDGGCGLGLWTVFLTDQGLAVTGLDISQATIARLKALLPGYDFVCGDVRHTGLPDAAFDAYFSWGTFEHFERGLGECIAEAWRVLKPGGLLMITVPFQNLWHTLRDLRPLHRWDPSYDPRAGYARRHRFYQWRLTRPELERELALHGFRVLRVVPVSKRGGVSAWLDAHARLFPRSTWRFKVARRLLTALAPGAWLAHMLLAVARKAETPP